MQMMNRPALHELGKFNEEPSIRNASCLVCIPVIYDVLRHHGLGPYPPNVLHLCKWLHKRGSDVLDTLNAGDKTQTETLSRTAGDDWRKASFLSMW